MQNLLDFSLSNRLSAVNTLNRENFGVFLLSISFVTVPYSLEL